MTRSSLLSAAVALLTIALASTGCGVNRTPSECDSHSGICRCQELPQRPSPAGRHGYFQQAAVPVAADQFGCALVRWRRRSLRRCNIMPNVTVDQNGVAQCRPGFVGTATVLAGTKSTAMTMPDEGPQLKVFGAAQISCP